MYSLLVSRVLQEEPEDSSVNWSSRLHHACTFKLDDTREARELFDKYAPNKRIGDVWPNFDETSQVLKSYLDIINGTLVDIMQIFILDKIPPFILKAAVGQYAEPFSKIWTAGDLQKGINIMIDESAVRGLEVIGMDLTSLKTFIQLISDIIEKKPESSIQSICHDYLGFNYSSLYYYLEEKMAIEGNVNLGIISDEFIEEVRRALVAPYALISFIAKIADGILKPFVKTFSDRNILKNIKAAADSISAPELAQFKQFLLNAASGKINTSIMYDVGNPYLEVEKMVNMLRQKGGFKKYLNEIVPDNYKDILNVIFEIFSGNDISKTLLVKLQDQLSQNMEIELYIATMYHFNPNFILYGEMINETIKFESLFGEETIQDLTTLLNTIFKAFKIAEPIAEPIYNAALPFIDIFRNVLVAITKNETTVGQAVESVIKPGKQIIEYINSRLNTPYSNVPTNLVNLKNLYTNLYRKSKLEFKEIPEHYYEFMTEVTTQLGDNYHLIANWFFTSLDSSLFKGEIIDLLKNFTDKHGDFNYGILMKMLSAAGDFALVDNTLKDIKKKFDEIAIPLASDDGLVEDLVKKVLKFNPIEIWDDSLKVLCIIGGEEIKVQDFAAMVSSFSREVKSAAKVDEGYKQAVGILPHPRGNFPIWAIAVIAVAAVIIISVTVVIVLIARRRKRTDLSSDFVRI